MKPFPALSLMLSGCEHSAVSHFFSVLRWSEQAAHIVSCVYVMNLLNDISQSGSSCHVLARSLQIMMPPGCIGGKARGKPNVVKGLETRSRVLVTFMTFMCSANL